MNITFKNKEEKMAWLKATGAKIKQMEIDRIRAIIDGEFEKATSLLKGRLLAQRLFGKVSKTLK